LSQTQLSPKHDQKNSRLLDAKFMYSPDPTQVQHMVLLLGKELLLTETRPKLRTQI